MPFLGASPSAAETPKVIVSISAPTEVEQGDMWWNSELGQLKIYYVDEDGSQWVDATGTTVTADVIRTNQAVVSVTTASTTLDFGTANDFKVSMESSTTFTFSNVVAGQSGNIYLIQDAIGGHTFTLPVIAKTPVNGAAITQETGADSVSILSYTVLDSNNVLVNYIGDFA